MSWLSVNEKNHSKSLPCNMLQNLLIIHFNHLFNYFRLLVILSNTKKCSFYIKSIFFFNNVLVNLAMWDNLKNENITYFMCKIFSPVKFALIICKLGKKFLRGILNPTWQQCTAFLQIKFGCKKRSVCFVSQKQKICSFISFQAV